ncbi:MAG: beta-lactamase family protein [Planctomycetaceae bacterium]|jgi:CubicO group peptidase (beta-lactamase class C family)|nr:beta-lactamase family protein [Planctomycetaceae bacterium]
MKCAFLIVGEAGARFINVTKETNMKCHLSAGLFVTVSFTIFGVVTMLHAEEPSPPASTEVNAVLQPYLDSHKIAGISTVIADKNGNILYRNLLGYADIETKKSISENSTFWIASMTKMFAGASLMMLVDEGKVRLDDPVTGYIPQLEKWRVLEKGEDGVQLLKPLEQPVTIRHLLSHTSGLTGGAEIQQVLGNDGIPLAARALSSVTGPLQSQPGKKYAYGNQGMNIAARIVEIVSRKPYEEFLQTRFFTPLGMTETTFWPNEDMIARLVTPYRLNPSKDGFVRGDFGYLKSPLNDRTYRYPEAGGGLFSTAHDILRYGLMLVNEGELDGKRYLSKEAIHVLRTEQTGETHVNYSLGYHLRNGMFGHDGAYGTDLSVNPDTGLTAVFMVQCSGGHQWEARDAFLRTAADVYAKAKTSR